MKNKKILFFLGVIVVLSLFVYSERLPVNNSDLNNWGITINGYMLKEHTGNGTHGNMTAQSLNVSGNVNLATSSGNVGIGKQTSGTKLDVLGGINASTLNIFGNVNLATSSGNVGIGTTAPAYKLDVSSATGATNVRVNTGDASTAGLILKNSLREWQVSVSGSGDGLRILDTAGGTTPIFIANGASTQSFNIMTNNKIGIGVASPTNTISINGDSARTFWIERHTTANTAGNNLTIESGGAKSASTDKTGGDLVLKSGVATGTGTSKITFKTHPAGSTGTTDTTDTTAMTILGSGNVGIGTTSPQTKLEVSGDALRLNFTNGCQGTCSKGTIAWNESNNKMCVCVATDTWYYANLTA